MLTQRRTDQVVRSAVIAIGEGQLFSLTTEMLKIERKTFKQSSGCQPGCFISSSIAAD